MKGKPGREGKLMYVRHHQSVIEGSRLAHLKRVEAALIRLVHGAMTHDELNKWRKIYLWVVP